MHSVRILPRLKVAVNSPKQAQCLSTGHGCIPALLSDCIPLQLLSVQGAALLFLHTYTHTQHVMAQLSCRSLRQLKREVKEAMQARRPLFLAPSGSEPSAEHQAGCAGQTRRPAVAAQVFAMSAAIQIYSCLQVWVLILACPVMWLHSHLDGSSLPAQHACVRAVAQAAQPAAATQHS